MKNSIKPDLSIRFMAVFSYSPKQGKLSEPEWIPPFPTFAYHGSGVNGTEVFQCLKKVENLDATDSACLHMLHPQARLFISDAVRHFRLDDLIANELKKTIWQTKAPQSACNGELRERLDGFEDGLAFRFKIVDICAALFPTSIMIMYVNIEPAFEFTDVSASGAAKLILHSFTKTGRSFLDGNYRSPPITRTFAQRKGDEEKYVPERFESINRRFGSNRQAIFQGICGKAVTLVDIIKDMLPDDCIEENPSGRSCRDAFLMGDRFLVNTFLMTKWEDDDRAFSSEDRTDLIRLARAEDDGYEPVKEPGGSDCYGIIDTFENIAFSVASEGFACWVKPRSDQLFLIEQFRCDRYDTIYLYLYLFALYQRYALVYLAKRLDEETPSQEEMNQFNGQDYKSNITTKTIEQWEEKSERLRRIRSAVSIFYLRSYFRQPATLTNHQEFYQGLHRVLGVSELMDEVNQASSQLEYIIRTMHKIIDSKHHRITALEQSQHQNDLLKQIIDLNISHGRVARINLMLAVALEVIAIPLSVYKLCYNLMHMSNHESIIVSGIATCVTVFCTIIVALGDKFKRTGGKAKNTACIAKEQYVHVD